MTEPYASIIIPTRNGLPLFERCLAAVFDQKAPWPFEVIVVDSGSTDGTWELAQSRVDQAIQIEPAQFNHGATRNQGAELARGSFLVFLVQDAIPTDDRWLVTLVEACARPGVAGSYSRHVVRPESDPITHYLSHGTTPANLVGTTKCLPGGRSLSDLDPSERLTLSVFADVSSCLRREVWKRYPLAPIPYGEDLEWGKRVIEAGHAIAYEPASAVFHSHDRSPFYYLKRAYADHFLVAEIFDYVMTPTIERAMRSSAWGVLGAWGFGRRADFSTRATLRLMLAAPLYFICLATGQYLGARMQRRLHRRRWARRLDTALRTGI